MALDLGALAQKKPAASASGQPLDLRCDDIDPDPDQPRREFDDAKLQELADSIRARAEKDPKGRGVLIPVSVRPHPTGARQWMLIDGERRWRASKIAEQETIPGFVDEPLDDDQALANDQREGLTPMELAHHIRRQLGKGRSQTDIARQLGRDKPTITHHLALIDLPPALAALYEDGRCRSPRMLYDLRRLHGTHGEDVDAWAARTGEVTRRAVDELRAALRPSKPSPAPTPSAEPVEAESGTDEPESATDDAVPTSIARPRLVVRHGEREASVLLERRPSEDGLLVVRFDDGTESELAAAELTIARLTEA